MSEVRLKSKIHKSLDQMDASQLKSAWLILKALSNQQKYAGIKVDERTIDRKIIEGIAQLDNGEGTDFGLFLSEIQVGYGSKK